MTIEQIVADCEAYGLNLSIRHMPDLAPHYRWSARVGDVKNLRTAATLDAAVRAAWLAYTGAEVA